MAQYSTQFTMNTISSDFKEHSKNKLRLQTCIKPIRTLLNRIIPLLIKSPTEGDCSREQSDFSPEFYILAPIIPSHPKMTVGQRLLQCQCPFIS